MCIVQHVERKSVFTFQPKKRLVSTTVKSANPAATFLIFLLRTKNRQLCCLALTVHIVLQKRRVATTKQKNFLLFWRNFSQPITTKSILTWKKEAKNHSIYAIIVSSHHWMMQVTESQFCFSFYTRSVYIKATWFSQSLTTVLSGLSTLDQVHWLWL